MRGQTARPADVRNRKTTVSRPASRLSTRRRISRDCVFRTASAGDLDVGFPGTLGQTQPLSSAMKPRNSSSTWSSLKKPRNKSDRRYDVKHQCSSYRIYNLERIYKETGCHPPCRYTQFSIPINPVSTSGDFNSTTLRIQFSKSSIIQRKELLVYPLSSFIAEFGGTLGLFLGFSFLVIWDQLEKLMWICRWDNIIGLRPCQRLTHS